MTEDIRAEAARYYDLSPNKPKDVPFYRKRLPGPEATVLELGCGTGRVLVPLARACGSIHGIDLSEAMVTVCREKLARKGMPSTRATADVGDITKLDIKRKFGLILAPFRVLQTLETDAEVDGLFKTIRKHLAADGTCILNVFKPNLDAERLRSEWVSDKESFCWRAPGEGGLVTCHERKPRMNPETMVLYPELIYRRYRGPEPAEEVVLQIAMRCYYPDGFEQLIVDHGFVVIDRWGGYTGEAYGEGEELIIQFKDDR